MQWLLTDFTPSLAKEIWTHFSFDLFQLWIKNFEIHVDFGGLSSLLDDSEAPNIADIFGGLDIEFYLFSHHLESAFLYNDADDSGDITVNYTNAQYSNGTDIIIDGQQAFRPDSNEVTHRIMLGDVGSFLAATPVADTTEKSITWGVTLNTAQIVPVPVGIDLNSYLAADREDLPFIQFNCKFIKELSEPDATGNQSATGRVKLQHNFAPWNGGLGPKNNISDLDLAIVYQSHIFHFHLNIENKNEELSELTQVEPDMVHDDTEVNETKKIQIGNYLNASGEALDFIDIAGENYTIGMNELGGTSKEAQSQIVPIGLWSFSGDSHQVHTGDVNTTTDDFSSDISLDISLNSMYYAVCYPDFDGSGLGIWHDPTFNIYMVFTPSSAGVWALILLIAAVGLAGIATIMIKKKKDREGF